MPLNSRVFQDIKAILSFLRSNRVRSHKTGLTDSLLRKRDKRIYETVMNRETAFRDESSPAKGPRKLTQRLFMCHDRKKLVEEEREDYGKQRTMNRLIMRLMAYSTTA